MLSDLVKNHRMHSLIRHVPARRHAIHQAFGRRGAVTLLGAVVAAGTAVIGLAGPAAAAGGTVNLVAYSTPKAAFAAEVAGFQATSAGSGVQFTQSFAASGTQANDVVSGLPADVVNFSTSLDMTKVATAGLVAKNWANTPTKGMVTNSIVSFIVRKGNPKHIKTWADLIKPGIQVVTPNPFSSGSAKWNLMAAYGAQTTTGKTKKQAQAYVGKLLKATVSQPSSASTALQAFLSGQGDVLLDYQDDATYAVSQGAAITVVTPPQSILIQNPIALTTSGAKNPAAKAFYKYVLSPAGQTIWAQQGYQPVLPSVAKKFKFPTPKTLFTIDSLGGWPTINTSFFDPTSGIVAKIETGLGVSTASS
jgi:sulfate/thiosulfate transport system substrate-binding protein